MPRVPCGADTTGPGRDDHRTSGALERRGVPAKGVQRLPIFGKLLGQQPERHQGAEPEILGLEHHTHLTAEFLQDAVVPTRTAGDG